ncbi:MAG TPA: pseudouridine-5'-phosphate glycosidase [Sphingobium sp.]|uniref:pseudouridine-5'-phosphate glycosidase n=1 Tax=Sphingobium sp. TaxID=1912891 RepID=UPI002ED4E6CF
MTAPHARNLLRYGEEVADALSDGLPVVALESNVITHGLRYPDNVETWSRIEDAVRAAGAVPATIGVENGRFLIGLTEADVERFASGEGIPKVSSRDLPVILARGGLGATTVASSLVAADLAGIRFFSSAGIGGVHRGAAQSLDISSDLIQFTRSRAAVVCAGAKNILDLRLTAEFLETHCVPVISYGFDEFPAFYCRSSGVRSPHRIDDLTELARAIDLHWELGAPGGVLVTAPIAEEDAIPEAEVEPAIAEASRLAEERGITGNALTKFLMRAVEEATGGRSARANGIVLVQSAVIAGQLAVAHAALHFAQQAELV